MSEIAEKIVEKTAEQPFSSLSSITENEYFPVILTFVVLFCIWLFYKCTCDKFASIKIEREKEYVTVAESKEEPEIKEEYIEGEPVVDSYYVPKPFSVDADMSPIE